MRAARLLLSAMVVLAAAGGARGAPPVLRPEPSPPGVTRYKFRITVGQAAPDCQAKRPVLLINGLFQPTFEVVQGDRLEVEVINDIPKSFPSVVTNGGLTIHWHGFRMVGNPWMDGTAQIGMCPIQANTKFTYNFTVDEPPGTYAWHDHAAYNRMDGMLGALIVRPPGSKLLQRNESEHVMLLQDWWHMTGGAMGVRLNRPFDPTQQTNDTGAWCWIGLPRSLLVNGKGRFADCEDVYARKVHGTLPNGSKVATPDTMVPTSCVAGQLGPKAAWPVCAPSNARGAAGACAREEFVVQPGRTSTFRIINMAAQVYMTVCFQGHNVTVVTADARPVEPKTFFECVDLNSGQRLDVQLTGNQKPGAYWVTVSSQYRKGAPSAFAVLRYAGASGGAGSAGAAAVPRFVQPLINLLSPPGASGGALPQAAPMQPEEASKRRWGIEETLSLVPPQVAGGGKQGRAPPADVDRRFIMHITQPIVKENGILRWALNNLMQADTPSCGAAMDELRAAPQKLAAAAARMAPNVSDAYYWPNATLLNGGGGGGGGGVRVLELGGPGGMSLVDAATPKAGFHLLTLEQGQTVEVILQNQRAGAFGGEYNTSAPLTSARNGVEQHPFHLHGQHFWIMGMGFGQWAPNATANYTLAAAPLRDTATLLFDPASSTPGWTAIRFTANNPGAWPLHCHILPHHTMGQALTLVVAPDQADPPPSGMPKCPTSCMYQFTRFTPALTAKAFGPNPLLQPANSNGNRRRLAGARRQLRL